MKKKDKKKQGWIKTVEVVLMVGLIMLMASEMQQYYKGFISVDNNFNYQNTIIEACNPDAPSVFELQDIGGDGKARPLVRYYIAGLNQMENAFMLNMLLALLLGILIREIIDERR